MDNIQGRNKSDADTRVASVGSDFHFGKEYGSRPLRVSPDEHDALAVAPRWIYWDYTEWCAGWFDQQRFAETAFDGDNLVV